MVVIFYFFIWLSECGDSDNQPVHRCTGYFTVCVLYLILKGCKFFFLNQEKNVVLPDDLRRVEGVTRSYGSWQGQEMEVLG